MMGIDANIFWGNWCEFTFVLWYPVDDKQLGIIICILSLLWILWISKLITPQHYNDLNVFDCNKCSIRCDPVTVSKPVTSIETSSQKSTSLDMRLAITGNATEADETKTKVIGYWCNGMGGWGMVSAPSHCLKNIDYLSLRTCGVHRRALY